MSMLPTTREWTRNTIVLWLPGQAPGDAEAQTRVQGVARQLPNCATISRSISIWSLRSAVVFSLASNCCERDLHLSSALRSTQEVRESDKKWETSKRQWASLPS